MQKTNVKNKCEKKCHKIPKSMIKLVDLVCTKANKCSQTFAGTFCFYLLLFGNWSKDSQMWPNACWKNRTSAQLRRQVIDSHLASTGPSYTVQGQGLAPLALGLAQPDPTRARVRARCWCLGPALIGSRAKTSDLAWPWPGPVWEQDEPHCLRRIK